MVLSSSEVTNKRTVKTFEQYCSKWLVLTGFLLITNTAFADTVGRFHLTFDAEIRGISANGRLSFLNTQSVHHSDRKVRGRYHLFGVENVEASRASSELKGLHVRCRTNTPWSSLSFWGRLKRKFGTTTISCESEVLGDLSWWILKKAKIADPRCGEARGHFGLCGEASIPLNQDKNPDNSETNGGNLE